MILKTMKRSSRGPPETMRNLREPDVLFSTWSALGNELKNVPQGQAWYFRPVIPTTG
jgi:hypothetical protein